MMVDAGLTHYVCACPDNVFYLTNFANYVHERPFILVVTLDGPLKFLVPKLEIPHVQARSVGDIELIEYFEFPAPKGETWDAKFQNAFSNGSRVGVESICPLQVYEAVPGERVRSDIVDDARIIKTDYEIARIVYASNVAAEAMNLLKGRGWSHRMAIRESRMSERVELICRLMVELGAEFEGLAEATTRQQRFEQLDADFINAIAIRAREAATIAEAAVSLARFSSLGLDLVRL